MNKLTALLTSTEFWVIALVSLYNVLVPVAHTFPNLVWLTAVINVVGLLIAMIKHSTTALYAKMTRARLR